MLWPLVGTAALPAGHTSHCDELLRVFCAAGGSVPCDALRRERSRNHAGVVRLEGICRETLRSPVLLGRAQMALTLAQRFVGDASDGLQTDGEVELDMDPAHFNETALTRDENLEEFFQSILDDPELKHDVGAADASAAGDRARRRGDAHPMLP